MIKAQRELDHPTNADEVVAVKVVKTLGRFSILPTPRIASCGWLMIGVPNRPPKTPGFVIVNVPPVTSSVSTLGPADLPDRLRREPVRRC